MELTQRLDQVEARNSELEDIAAEDETRMLADDNKIVELEMQLQHAADLLKEAQAAKQERPTCTEALYPAKPDTLKLWIFSSQCGYQLRLVHHAGDAVGWRVIKTDGTSYDLTEPIRGPLTCTCPGCSQNGPYCSEGRGCKHIRMLRAVRNVVYPGLVTIRR